MIIQFCFGQRIFLNTSKTSKFGVCVNSPLCYISSIDKPLKASGMDYVFPRLFKKMNTFNYIKIFSFYLQFFSLCCIFLPILLFLTLTSYRVSLSEVFLCLFLFSGA